MSFIEYESDKSACNRKGNMFLFVVSDLYTEKDTVGRISTESNRQIEKNDREEDILFTNRTFF